MAPASPQHLLDLTREELAARFVAAGKPPFHAGQIVRWVYARRVADFADMTDLSKHMRDDLTGRYLVFASRVARDQRTPDGTRKLLLIWPDGAATETVLIPDRSRRTACLSTQAGCPVGCTFCASGADGLQRDLTAGEIVEQALRLTNLLPVDERLTNVVLMGSGEPLANYNATLRAIGVLNADWGLAVGARRITVSTIGLPKQIRKLANEGYPVNLAISLHAPNDELRRELIPWAKQIRIREVLAAARYYFQQTGREVTLEYVLLAGVNDRPTHADQFAALAGQVRCNVNLIPYNPVPDLTFTRPTGEQARRFQDRLRAAGVNTQLRASRGRDIDAACGQLRRRHAE